MRILTVAMLLGATPALAGQTLEGSRIKVSYGDLGVWNDRAERAGFSVMHGDEWVEYTYPGTPYASWRVSWEDGGSAPEEYFVTSSTPDGNVTVISEDDLSTDDMLVSRHTYQTGALRVQKTETWGYDASTMLVHVYIQNDDSRPVSDLVFLYAVDPDQDNGVTTNTLNDARDTDEDGTPDLVVSAGPDSGRTMAFGACDPAQTEVGHFSNWRGQHTARVTLADNEAAAGDWAMAIRVTVPGELAPGDATQISLLVGVGDTDVQAVSGIDASSDLCRICDADADGWLHPDCGGSDCDDNNPEANPSRTEVYYDGVDGDCDGKSDYDADGDGFDSDEHDGEDCDDDDAAVFPGAEDTPYDGIDSDCDGASDLDADGDGYDSGGHGGDDCDDSDDSIHPGADDAEDDGTDSDCDGLDGPAIDPELAKGECGCSATSTPTGGFALLLLGGLVGLRRRR